MCKQSMICNNKALWCESLYSLLTHPWIITLSCLSPRSLGPVDLPFAAVSPVLVILFVLGTWSFSAVLNISYLGKAKFSGDLCLTCIDQMSLFVLKAQVGRSRFHVSERPSLQIFRNLLNGAKSNITFVFERTDAKPDGKLQVLRAENRSLLGNVLETLILIFAANSSESLSLEYFAIIWNEQTKKD